MFDLYLFCLHFSILLFCLHCFYVFMSSVYLGHFDMYVFLLYFLFLGLTILCSSDLGQCKYSIFKWAFKDLYCGSCFNSY